MRPLTLSSGVNGAESRFLHHLSDYDPRKKSVNSSPTRWIISNPWDFLQPVELFDFCRSRSDNCAADFTETFDDGGGRSMGRRWMPERRRATPGQKFVPITCRNWAASCRIALHVCLWAINLRNWSCEPGSRPVTGGLFRNPTKEALAGNSAGSRAPGCHRGQ